jgi:hypothetical protein
MPLRALEPKSSASANSATLARNDYNGGRRSSARRSSGPAKGFPRLGRNQSRGRASAGARQRLDLFSADLEVRRFDVQTVVSFAFGRKQPAGSPDDLLEHGHSIGLPQSVPLRLPQAWAVSASQHDHGVGRHGRSSQRLQLIERTRDRLRREIRGSAAPSAIEHTNASGRPEPRHQHRGARRRLERRNKRPAGRPPPYWNTHEIIVTSGRH